MLKFMLPLRWLFDRHPAPESRVNTNAGGDLVVINPRSATSSFAPASIPTSRRSPPICTSMEGPTRKRRRTEETVGVSCGERPLDKPNKMLNGEAPDLMSLLLQAATQTTRNCQDLRAPCDDPTRTDPGVAPSEASGQTAQSVNIVLPQDQAMPLVAENWETTRSDEEGTFVLLDSAPLESQPLAYWDLGSNWVSASMNQLLDFP